MDKLPIEPVAENANGHVVRETRLGGACITLRDYGKTRRWPDTRGRP
jgi:hypothetical protein